LANDLLDLLTKSPTILEIAVVDAKTNDILADSDPARIGAKAEPYPDFRDFVAHAGILEKLKVLRPNAPHYFQLDRVLATPGGDPVLRVRVVIAPIFIS